MKEKILVTGGSGFIGTNLIEKLLQIDSYIIKSIDKRQPLDETHKQTWQQVDLLDKGAVIQAFTDFSPKLVVHLAARTDTDPDTTLEDYKVNTDGTANVLEAIKVCRSIERVIITSTQFVNQYNGLPKHDEDYAPHTVYGESKVITEQLTRAAKLNCIWTIIRPTNIWGPWHPRYPREFWFVLKKGKYVHPGKQPVIRSYGYVGNVVDQMLTILNTEPSKVDKQVFYVGDGPVNLYDWVNTFSLALNNRQVRVVPRKLVKGLAIVGEALRKVNISFPITLSRYKSMTNGNSAPMEKTFAVLGFPKISLQKGVEETAVWLGQQDNFWKS